MRIATRMARSWVGSLVLAALLLALVWSVRAQAASPDLADTSWQLANFHDSGDNVLTPQNKAKYTITFGTDGRVSVRIDCNRGTGTWKTSAPDHLTFGPLALTRAQCPPALLTDRIAGNWQDVHSYTVRDGRLFLSLVNNAGTFEFAPGKSESRTASTPASAAVPDAAVASNSVAASNSPAAVNSPVTSIGPVRYACTRSGGGSDTLKATFYQTTPGLVLVVRGGETRPAFQVLSADGGKYEGPQLSFWDARGEAMITWSGLKLECKPQH